MIDVESLVVDSIKKRFATEGVTVRVESTYNPTPSSFPFVSVYEADNHTYRKTQDDVAKEHHASVMYEVNVYSNKQNGKKQEAKKLFNIVDDTLQNFKFTRTTMIPDMNRDKSIYQIVARYEAVIAEGQTINDNTVYQVYRE